MVLQTKTQSDHASPLGKFTYAEILQQPELWPTTLQAVTASGWQDRVKDRPVIISGAGTSAYAAAAIAAGWPNAQAIPTTELLVASRDEIETASREFPDAGLLISIGRSGDSPESVAVVDKITHFYRKVDHLVITCNADGQLARTPEVESIILDPRSNDRSLAMTSSFSNLVLAGLCLRDGQELKEALPAVCTEVQKRLPELDATAERLSTGPVERVVTLASGALRALATETSLKVLEMTAGRTSTLAETFLGLRHGPMSFLTPDTLVLCFLSSSRERRRYEEDLVSELREKRIGRLIGIAPDGVSSELFDACIPAAAGQLPDKWRVPFEIPFSQLFAYHLSLKTGLDPDNPSPIGAITRVVKKFVIYGEISSV